MNAREFATASLKGADLDGMGVKGYTLRKTLEMDKPRVSVIMPYKNPTFLDMAVKMKKHVPDANYNVIPDLKDKSLRSGLPKGRRSLISEEIMHSARRSPAPECGSYKPNYIRTEKRIIGAFNLKGSRQDTSFLAEPSYKGSICPNFYNTKYSVIEPRIKGRAYTKPINTKLDSVPHFLRERKATHLISPMSHNPLDSYKKTQTERIRFCSTKGSPRSIGEAVAHKKKWVPAPSHYNPKDLEKGWNAISQSPTRSKRH